MERNAHDIALKYLSYRNRTTSEMEEHLRDKGCSIEEIKETIEFLTACKLLDDRDYCERYISYCIEKGRGPLRIERELLAKGIASGIIQISLESQFDGNRERELAQIEAAKILRRTEQQGRPCLDDMECKVKRDEKELARMARRLASQGYHSSVIYEILRNTE
jgi:SOS response regulatory protein OraA/RecX